MMYLKSLAKAAALIQLGLFLSLPAFVLPSWDALVRFLHGPMWANVVGVPLLHLVVLLVANSFFMLLYTLDIPFFEQFKISRKPWAWKNDPAAFRELLLAAVKATAFNLILTVPLAYFNYETSVKFGYSASLKTFPSTSSIALHILAFMVIEDAMFYMSHRLLHTFPTLYKNVHKFHHKWHQSTSIAAESTHPIEFIIGNVLPFATGPLLCGAHLIELYMWTIWRIGETVTNHSGYDFPWSPWSILPFQGSAAAHDAHHSVNTGNYASFFCWWDWIFGTEIPHEKVVAHVGDVGANSPVDGKADVVANGDGASRTKKQR